MSLNTEQLSAITNPYKRILVLAGAGAGKTKTLIEKVNHLISNLGAKGSEILAITFTKNAANEMLDRLIAQEDKSGAYQKVMNAKIKAEFKDIERKNFMQRIPWIQSLTMSTFHSLCYRILRDDGVTEFDNKFKIITKEKVKFDELQGDLMATENVSDIMQKVLIELCEDRDFLIAFKRNIIDHYAKREPVVGQKLLNKYEDQKFYISLNGTAVRSKSEQYIADWLYRHGIAFVYEPILSITLDFAFKPDFYIPEANLYLEHISDKSYTLHDKIKQLERGGKSFVITTEEITHDTTQFNKALDRIIRDRLPANYKKEAALAYEEEMKTYFEDVQKFLRDVSRVQDMITGDNLSVDVIKQKATQDQHDRIRSFYVIAIPLIESFNQYCVNKSYLDFNMMVNRTITLLQNNEVVRTKYQQKYKYILVDEFQDVNSQQVNLIKLLLTDDTQLFCVGDDWQSIYGFRGSNVSHIIEFNKHFPDSEIIKFTYNYRSTDKIVGASNEVIKNNKYQIEKDIQSLKASAEKIVVFNGIDIHANVRLCIEQVKELLTSGYTSDDILFLYRRSKMFDPYFEAFRDEQIFITRRTIHSAKGLEAKAVFILGLIDGSSGFPDTWLDDRIFQIVKETNQDTLLEEERRLFYVALTRAKEKLFLVTEKGMESKFIAEIPNDYVVRTSTLLAHEPLLGETCQKCGNHVERLWKFCAFCNTALRIEN